MFFSDVVGKEKKKVSVLWKMPICSKMDNKCPFPNSLPFSANHWMALRHFVSHFANSADNGSYLWPEKLLSINYCISHKAGPLPSLTLTQTTTVKYCKWSCLIFTYPPPILHHFIITALVYSVLSRPTEVAASSRWLLYELNKRLYAQHEFFFFSSSC